jgi:hypothetical protein
LLPSHIPPSPYHLSATLTAQYCGRYTLQAIDRRTRLTSGGIYITREPDGSVLGLVQFYGYDHLGYQTDWFAVLSNFHALAYGRMSIELYDQAGQDLHDRLVVTRNARGDLAGQFTLDGQTYAIRWHRISSR